MSTMTLDKDSAEYVRMMADAQHDGDKAAALKRLIKIGYTRINAITRHASGDVDKKWPAPGRTKKAPKKTKKAAEAPAT